MKIHSNEKQPAKKLMDKMKINVFASLSAGTVKTKEVIKTKDKSVAINCKIKNVCALLLSNSLLSLTLTHSLTAKFGIPILAKIKKYITKVLAHEYKPT